MSSRVEFITLQAPNTNTTQDFVIPNMGTTSGCYIHAIMGTPGTDTNHIRSSRAFWDGTNIKCTSMVAEDNATSGWFKGNTRTSNVVFIQKVVVDDFTADRSATIALASGGNGITLTWSGDITVRPYVTVMLISGLLNNAVGGFVASDTDLDTVIESGLGFTPNLIFAFNNNGVTEAASAACRDTFGVAYDDGTSITQTGHWSGFANSSTYSLRVTDAAIGIGGSGPTPLAEFIITEMSSGQFSLQTDYFSGSSGGSEGFMYWAMDIDIPLEIFTSTLPITAVDWTPYSAGILKPQRGLMGVHLKEFNSTASSGSMALGSSTYYFDNLGYEYSFGIAGDSGLTPSDVSCRVESFLFQQLEVAGTPDFDASEPILNSGSVTFSASTYTQGGASNAGAVYGIVFGGMPNVYINVVPEIDGNEVLQPYSSFNDEVITLNQVIDTGVLAEPAGTNLCLQSEDFTTSWTNTWGGGCTITANNAIAPDGQTTAEKLERIVDGDGINIYFDDIVCPILTPNAEHTVSMYLKQEDAIRTRLLIWDETAAALNTSLNIQWSGQTPSTEYVNGPATNITYTEDVNDWWRVSFTFISKPDGKHRIVFSPEANGSGTEGLWAWGAQMEEGPYVTSYIPTTTTTVTDLRYSRINLCHYSEDIGNWNPAAGGCTITADDTTAPDGELTADHVEQIDSTSDQMQSNLVALSDATVYTASGFLKNDDAGQTTIWFWDNGASSGDKLVLDWSGTVPSVSGGSTATNPVLTEDSNDWWRLSFQYTTTSANNHRLIIEPHTSSTATLGVWAWGFQMEKGAYLTSYIPTLTAENGVGLAELHLLIETRWGELLTRPFELIGPPLTGSVFLNNAASYDGNEVLQAYPGNANWFDNQISLPNLPVTTGLTESPMYVAVETAEGNTTWKAITFSAYPILSGITYSEEDGSNVSTHNVLLPPTIVAGDLIVVLGSLDSDGSTLTWDNTTAGTWTAIYDQTYGGSNSHVHSVCYVKIADGTEQGLTLQPTTGSLEQSSWFSFIVHEGTWAGDLQGVNGSLTDNTGNITSVDPPNNSPSWGSASNLWIGTLHADNGDSPSVSAWPETDNQNESTSASTGGSLLAFCTVEATAASRDISAFTISTAEQANAGTLAIAPLGTIFSGTVNASVTFDFDLDLDEVGDIVQPSAEILQVKSQTVDTLDQTSDTQLNGMTITPPAGDYLLVFSGEYFLPEIAGTAHNHFSVYVDGSKITHSERLIKQDGSYESVYLPASITCKVSPNGSQAVQIMHSVTNATLPCSMNDKELILFPITGTDYEVSATGDDTIATGAFTQLDSMTVTPAAGDYLLTFSTSVRTPADEIVGFKVTVGGTTIDHTWRLYEAEGSFPQCEQIVVIACKVSPNGSQDVDIEWWRQAGVGTMTCRARTMNLIPVESNDIYEVSSVTDDDDSTTDDVAVDNTNIESPGAGNYLCMFTGSHRMGAHGDYIHVSYYFREGNVAVADTTRRHSFDESADNLRIPVHLSARITVSGTNDLDVYWPSNSVNTRTLKERTFIAVRLAEGSSIVNANITFTYNADKSLLPLKTMYNFPNFNMTLDENYSVSKITSELESFNITSTSDLSNTKDTSSTSNLSLILDKLISNTKDTYAASNLNLILDKFISNTKDASDSAVFNLVLDKIISNAKDTSDTIVFDSVLDKVITNTKDTSDNIAINLVLDKVISSTKGIPGNIIFDSVLDKIITNTRDTSDSTNFSILVDKIITNTRDTSDSISFNILIDKVLDSFKDISDNINFNILANKVLANTRDTSDSVNLNILVDKVSANTRVVHTSNLFNIIFDETISNTKAANENINLNLIVDILELNNKITSNTSVFDINLEVDNINNKITNEVGTLDIILDKNISSNRAVSESIIYNILLNDYSIVNKILEDSLNFNITLDELNTLNKISYLNTTLGITLDQVQFVTKSINKFIDFDISTDISQLNQKNVNETIYYTLDASFTAFLDGIIDVAVNFGLSLDDLNNLQKIANESHNFALTIEQAQEVQKIISTFNSFDVEVDHIESNFAERLANFTADINLNYIPEVQLNKLVSYIESISLTEEFINNKSVTGLMAFDTVLNFNILLKRIGHLNISLDTILDTAQSGVPSATVFAAISFLANLDQQQTNVVTVHGAINFLLDLAEEQNVQLDKVETLSLILQLTDSYVAGREINTEKDFSIDVDQSATNTAFKVGLITLDTILNQESNPAGSNLNAIIELASSLSILSAEDNEVLGFINYSLILDQDINNTQKITSTNMSFNIEADVIREISLVVDGLVNFSTLLNQTELKHRIKQTNITFGHILGLASLNSAELAADLTLGVVTDVQISGSTLIFILNTPDRTLRVYIEDRTMPVESKNRTIFVQR